MVHDYRFMESLDLHGLASIKVAWIVLELLFFHEFTSPSRPACFMRAFPFFSQPLSEIIGAHTQVQQSFGIRTLSTGCEILPMTSFGISRSLARRTVGAWFNPQISNDAAFGA